MAIRLVSVFVAVLCASGCATRCTLVAVDTQSQQLDAFVSWDTTATPSYQIVARIPWQDLEARARAVASNTSRIVVSATVVDACGEIVGGQSWPRQIDLSQASPVEVFELRSRLGTVVGPQRLTLAILLQGEAYLSNWQRTFDVPGAGPAGLIVEQPQFWSTGSGSEASSEPVLNVARYYDERSGPPQVRSVVHDLASRPGETYALEYRVRAADESVVYEGVLQTAGRGRRTPFEIELPVRGLGRHVLEIEVREGTRIATTSGQFDVGFADLASWGSAESGRVLLSLLFSPEELAPLEAAAPVERAAVWQRLWEARDPDPTTRVNEFQDAIRRRIQEATVRYSEGEPGWQTDRGRVYVVWGPPEQIDVFQSPNALDRTERWTYDGGNTVFVFVDVRGVGIYELKRTNATEFLRRMRGS